MERQSLADVPVQASTECANVLNSWVGCSLSAMPRMARPSLRIFQPRTPSMHRTDKLRILIADDHELIRRGIRDLLSVKVDWQVIAEACDGPDAVRLASEFKPDLAILDFSMPDMNGPQVTRELARVSALTKVIILTMHDSEQVIRKVLESGASG